MTDEECMALLQSDCSLNKARQVFSSYCGRLEQAQAQRNGLTPIEWRKMEFEAVEAITKALI